jgi:two-component system CheB/CheR fusion protein
MVESMASVGLQLGRVIERKTLQDRLLTLSEEEHRRIGQELHDDVGQEMTGLAMKAETLVEMLREDRGPTGDLARDVLVSVNRTQRKLRALSRGLVPMEVDAPALEDALGGLARQLNEGKEIFCQFVSRSEARVADSRTATQLYRIAQEAVANIARHSQAEHVDILLVIDDAATTLEIRDDGQGLPAEWTGGLGMGLQIMRYRASLIGGILTVESLATGGTLVTCRLSNRGRGDLR